jgi:MOSC domain-containing protein YiiM
MEEFMRGKIYALSISKRKGVPKKNVDEVFLIENFGIEGDIHAGSYERQVSLLAIESIEKMRRKGLVNLRPGAFAENITTQGIDLLKLEIGDILKINDVELKISKIGKECHTKCAIFYKVGDCVMPREGVFAIVLKGGKIRKGDDIIVIKKNKI